MLYDSGATGLGRVVMFTDIYLPSFRYFGKRVVRVSQICIKTSPDYTVSIKKI